MNFKNLFNNRNKNFARLNEAGDYLGRRLRENLVIYDIDDSNSRVTYVTESNNLISCYYKETGTKLTLEDFTVNGLDEVVSDDAVDAQVRGSVHKFVTGLVNDRYDKAEVSFDAIVESFTMRAKIEESRKKLYKKMARFGETYNITETKAYAKFEEITPMLEKFLAENADELKSNGKLIEGLRLSKVVGDTYDLPKLTLEGLANEFIVVPSNTKKTLYEMVCEKELVRKELMEAKESFSRMWSRNGQISQLASHIYSTDSTVKAALEEAVMDIPYIALSNKVDLSTVMESVFEITNPGTISQKDIREFVGKIYEFKKPLKTKVINALNEKYGVNVQSLRFVPSFKGLAEVQSEIFSILSEAAGEGILSDVLKEFSVCMSRKGGVQVLDISNMLSSLMKEAKFTVVDIDEDFEMKKLSDYLRNDLDEAQYYGDDDELSSDPGEGSSKKKGKKDKDWGGNKGDIKAKDRKKDDDSDLEADEKGDVDYNDNDLPGDEGEPTAKKKKGGKGLSKKQKKMDKDGDGDIDGKDLKKLRKEGVAEAEQEVAADGETEEASSREAADVAAFNDTFEKINDIAKDMKLDLEPDTDDDVDTAPEEDAEVEQDATDETEPTQ
jgi:hypothetical protein